MSRTAAAVMWLQPSMHKNQSYMKIFNKL